VRSWTIPIKALALGCLCAFPMAPAQAESGLIQVDMQLVLAVDISFSISVDELDIQRRGYVAAFQDPDVIASITNGYRGRIAVTVLEWAGEDSQYQVVPWMLIADPISANVFAERLNTAPVRRKGRTSLSQALTKALGLFRQSPFRSNRLVIDISSDGFNNNGARIDRARDKVEYHGITVNGLPLMAGKSSGIEAGLDDYFQDCVITGLGAFVEPVLDWQDFGPTLKKKLIAEISGPAYQPVQARIYRASETPAQSAGFDCLTGEKEDLMRFIQQLQDATGQRAPRWLPREQDWPMPD
jgi:Protein of unknown function (DUF1194)